MITWIVVLALLWPLLWVARWMMVTRLLLGLEFRRGVVRGHAPDQVPEHLREAAMPWWRDLDAQRFRLIGGWTIEQHAEAALNSEAMVFLSEDGLIRAILRPAPESARSGECTLSLRSTTKNGYEIVTLSFAPEALTPTPAAIQVEAMPTTSAAVLLNAHRERLSKGAIDPWLCADLEDAVAREQHICDAEFAVLNQSGWVTRTAEGSLSYRLLPALARSASLLRQAAKQKKMGPKGPPPPPAISDDALEAFDFQHYRQFRALHRGRLSRRNKSILSVVSLVLFMGALVYQGSPVAAAALLVALVIHEFGHLAGMWMFGYKDTQLLFIPFLGGAAVAHDDKVLSPWKHVVILLLGPLPGLFIGIALGMWNAWMGGPDWLSTTAYTFIGLNAFNLAPIMPLDGGQLCDVAFASRFPRLRVVFMAVSGAALMLMGWGLGGPSLLTGLGVLMLLGVRSQWRLAELRRDVRAEYPDGGDEETIVRRVLRGLREPQWAKVAMVQRLALVQGVQIDLRAPKPGFGTLAFAGFAYASPIWLGLPLAVLVSQWAGEKQVTAALARAAQAGLVAAPPPPASPALPAQSNAAVPYTRAVELAANSIDRRFDPAADDDSGAANAEIVGLLRSAAQKPAFAPLPDPAVSGLGRFYVRQHGQVVHQLLQHGHQRVHFGEATEALAIAADALRLTRLMQTAPGWLSWSAHVGLETGGWKLVEEALHAGAKPTAPYITLLRALANDTTETYFAANAIPAELLGRTSSLQLDGDESALSGLLTGLTSLSPEWTRMRARGADEAIAARDALRRVVAGEWPAVPTNEGDLEGVAFQLAQLADVIARQRQARAALAWLQQPGTRDATPQSPSESGAPFIHPYSREPLKVVRRGSTDVLVFTALASKEFTDEDVSRELLWRLPARP